MMSWLSYLTMGCVCARESMRINNNRYYVRSRLGEGGFSVVDLVESVHTHKRYALKRIVCHSKQDETGALLEVEMSNMFNHINIIKVEDYQVLDCQRENSTVVSEVLVLLPFYKRGTLQDAIDRMVSSKERIPEMRLLRLFRGICEAVRTLHHCKPDPIAHRDLKPGNVLLTDDDIPVLMDFGSASKARVEIHNISQALSLQDAASEKCTMPYRAPELFDIESRTTISEKTDIWSLGCVLYSLAFLQSPFDDAYQKGGSIALAAKSKKFKYPDNTKYSREIKDLIDFMMVVEPCSRPNIDSVLHRLEDVTNTIQGRI